MTEAVARRALFRCDGAAIPPRVRGERWDVAGDITARGPEANLTLVVESLAGKVVGEVDPRARDLVRIAAYCYAADLRVPRTGIDVHRRRWRRDLLLYITVAEPAFWSDPDVADRLGEALGFATEDDWAFVFQQAEPEDAQLPIAWDGREVLDRPDAVVLFSGGVDSLCALVGARAARPVVVSHWPAKQIKARQQRLLADVRRRFPDWAFPLANFEIHRRGDEHAESSQRSRGFLYACLGAAIAAHHGIPEAQLADNGYVSVNPPITDQLVGALASRGTHPKFLHLVNRLLARVFPAGVRVVNPLWDRTRAEALGLLVEAGCPDLLARTYSCGKQQGHPAGKRHCGGCSQCVDRRVAAIEAGLEAHDSLEYYELDLFVDELAGDEPRTIALDYFRFSDQVAALDPDGIVDRYPQLDDCLVADDSDSWDRMAAIAGLLKRHAEEAMRVLDLMAARQSRALIRHRLHPSSLLPLWIGGGGDAPAASAADVADAARFGVEPEHRGSSFVWAGGVWLVEFRDEKQPYPHAKGMMQLAHLLENPKQRLDVVALARCEAAPAPPERGPEGLASGIGGGLGPVLSPEIMLDLQKRRKRLPAEIQAARARGRTEMAKQLEEELRAAKKALRDARGLGGRPRQLGGPEEKARKAVSRNVHFCYERFAAEMPRFLKHAERFVHLGIPPCYDPEPPERWKVTR